MDVTGKLADYPGLARWYHEQGGKASDLRAPPELLVWRTCEALCTEGAAAVRHFLDGFRQFLAQSADTLGEFLAAEALMHRCDAELLDLIGELGETAVREGLGEAFLIVMRAGAEGTGLTVLRFLSAWTALNTGRLEDCVSECEKIDTPHGAVFTVHGQALLELGRAAEAAEVLDVAVKLTPGEILAWFQLAKAHHVLGRGEAALAALRECRRLAPQSDEVGLYIGMVTLDTLPVPPLAAATSGLADEAFLVMRPLLRRHADNPTVVFTLLRLAARQGKAGACADVLAQTAWPELLARRETLGQLTTVLRELHAVGWMDVAAELLSHVVPAAGRAS